MGIKKKDLSKLFKYFGKLNDTQKINTKGTGLGLMISRKIVQSMGGEINIESEVNNGTKFNISVNIQVKNPLFQKSLDMKDHINCLNSPFDQSKLIKTDFVSGLNFKSILDQVSLMKTEMIKSEFDGKSNIKNVKTFKELHKDKKSKTFQIGLNKSEEIKINDQLLTDSNPEINQSISKPSPMRHHNQANKVNLNVSEEINILDISLYDAFIPENEQTYLNGNLHIKTKEQVEQQKSKVIKKYTPKNRY